MKNSFWGKKKSVLSDSYDHASNQFKTESTLMGSYNG